VLIADPHSLRANDHEEKQEADIKGQIDTPTDAELSGGPRRHLGRDDSDDQSQDQDEDDHTISPRRTRSRHEVARRQKSPRDQTELEYEQPHRFVLQKRSQRMSAAPKIDCPFFFE
jgi:hypothetical protein